MAQGSGILEKQNICTYVENNLDTFAERPLCAPDSLVLSWFSNYRLEALGGQFDGWDITSAAAPRLRDALRAECFDGLFDLWDPESCRRLLQAMAASPRFRDIRVGGFRLRRDTTDPEWPKQFAAVTLLLDDGTAYLAFRGTDATFDGWREDFNMTFARPVPAQAEAFLYLLDAAEACPGAPLVLGGHSKGGNLAVYAAAEAPAEIRERVSRVYSHDGPGFDAEFLASEGYCAIAGRVDKTLPQSSVVGMMLENQEDYSVVRSTSVGIFQHDPFSWVVDGCAFVEVEKLSAGARHVDAALNDWICGRTPAERDRFTSELFGLLGATNATTMAEARERWRTSLPAMAAHLADMDPETRRFMLKTVGALVRDLLPGSESGSDEDSAPADAGEDGTETDEVESLGSRILALLPAVLGDTEKGEGDATAPATSENAAEKDEA